MESERSEVEGGRWKGTDRRACLDRILKYKKLLINALQLTGYVNCHTNVTLNFWHFWGS